MKDKDDALVELLIHNLPIDIGNVATSVEQKQLCEQAIELTRQHDSEGDEWINPNIPPIVERGKECPYWIAVKDGNGKSHVFMAYYQNRPFNENIDNCDNALIDFNGDYISSVGWVDARQHVDFDDYWEALNFNENYELLGWAEYVKPLPPQTDKEQVE